MVHDFYLTRVRNVCNIASDILPTRAHDLLFVVCYKKEISRGYEGWSTILWNFQRGGGFHCYSKMENLKGWGDPI